MTTSEREHFHKAVASLQITIGVRPLGWYYRHGPNDACGGDRINGLVAASVPMAVLTRMRPRHAAL
jgi:hypothetical protein